MAGKVKTLAGLLADGIGALAKGASRGGKTLSIPDDVAAMLAKQADPANVRGAQIVDLLRSGRSDDVTDEMLDMGDPVLNANLNQYLYRNYDLPMDEASRMDRKGQIGHKGGLYSGTGEDFTSFNNPAAFATNNPDLAYTYAPRDSGSIMPLTMRAMNGSPVIEAGGANFNKLTPSMRAGGGNAPYLPNILTDQQDIARHGEDTLRTDDIVRAAKAQGFSGVTFNDMVDVGGYFSKYFPEGPLRDAQAESTKRAFMPSTIEARMYPNQVRSQFARFDPRLSHLKNLSAAAAGTGLLGIGMQDRNIERGF